MPLLQLARHHPLATERLDRVRWISLGLGDRGAWIAPAALPAEMTVYMFFEDGGS